MPGIVAAGLLWVWLAGSPQLRAAEESQYRVGVAQLDITPDYPVRLSGFGFRRTESVGVTQKIWTKALALQTGRGDIAVLVTTDNLGVPATVVNEVAARLGQKAGLKRERFTVTATHTHTAPMLRGVAPTLFSVPIPPEHQSHIDRYTRDLTDKIEQVSLAAIKDLAPGRLSWGIGSVKFAINRRTPGGPVDHDLPTLVVKNLDGQVRAIYVNYACHCVTLSDNQISGDWAGFAQELIQREFPHAIALISVGCGADSNPSSGPTGNKVAIAEAQGLEIAAEVKRLTNGFLAPLEGELTTRLQSVTLDFAPPPSREEFMNRVKKGGYIGYHAQVQLSRLDRGEAL
ncbi:MAG: Neutral/alkaline non-lysosomal ceramidase, partial [Planctomycetaceae bacterium]|nr:Neutral/alkaline non-lysosomal ceramidase [Planctomycetaceae bacterium]